MEEYLVQCQGKWWHFFIKPFYGLCYRWREAGRFSNFEVLLPEAQADFCVTVVGESIHLVCQDTSGRILYLTKEEAWEKTVLLESKSSVPYPKHFSLIPSGRFINLFYVIMYQEKIMLVHQIPGMDRPPTVVDRITSRLPMFIAGRSTGNDITVYYENENGVSGSRVFRWSQKTFGRFVPVNPSVGGRVCCVMPESGERVRYGALQPLESVRNLVYFEQTEEGFTQAVTVNLDCPEDAVPVFCREGEKLYLSWRESGSVLSSCSTDDGVHWSKPVRYMKGASVTPILYTVCEGGKIRQRYGFEREREIVFYIGSGLSDTVENQEKREFRPAGYEVEDFAREMGVLTAKQESMPENPVYEGLRREVQKLKEQLFSVRKSLVEQTERLEALERLKDGGQEETAAR